MVFGKWKFWNKEQVQESEPAPEKKASEKFAASGILLDEETFHRLYTNNIYLPEAYQPVVNTINASISRYKAANLTPMLIYNEQDNTMIATSREYLKGEYH